MKTDKWWGSFSFKLDEAKAWSQGARQIVLQRSARQWRLWDRFAEQEQAASIVVAPVLDTEAYESRELSRYLQTETAEEIQVLPRLADRSFVVRPAGPLNVLPEETASVYVSTPVWFFAYTHDDQSKIIADIPFARPSDTWFGSSTREGELSYSKYTDARLDLHNLEIRSYRAVTPIFIKNNHKSTLRVERINLPVPLLRLYGDGRNQLWTESLTVHREPDDDASELVLGKGAPEEAVDASFVNDARVQTESGTIIRSIKSLFA